MLETAPHFTSHDPSFRLVGSDQAVMHSFNSTNQLTDQDSFLAAERQALAVDMYRVGSLAVGSTVEAATITGQTYHAELASPFTPQDLKPTKVRNVLQNPFRLKVAGPKPSVLISHQRLADESAHLQSLTPESAPDYVRQAEDLFSASAFEDQIDPTPTAEYTFDHMDIPALLRGAKESSGLSWREWLRSGAEPIQKQNFAQWYHSEASRLTDPWGRESTIAGMKNQFRTKVEQAMANGWIDPSKHGKLLRSLDNAKVHFFSPFSAFANKNGGVNLSNQFIKNGIMLPVGAGQEVATHEFGHSLGGVNHSQFINSMFKDKGRFYVPDDNSAEDLAAVLLFKTIDEGYNEHFTASLTYGSPTIVNPQERKAAHIEHADASETYTVFRGVFGTLIGGPDSNGIVSKSDIRQVTSMMIDKDYKAFEKFVTAKWQGRPVIKQLFETLKPLISAKEKDRNAILPKDMDAIQAASAKVFGK